MARTHILISAGEASGDMYAARLAAALPPRADVRLFGMGGARMREAGVELVADCSEVASRRHRRNCRASSRRCGASGGA